MDKISKLFKHSNKDIPASIVVFLVALPLCLGIALASGAPLISGMIAGIIGGIVVGALSGSHLSVSGPAAGLTVIVLGAIADLGGFQFFLVAVVLAGIIQIIMGVLNAGIVGLYFPSSVIKGMLAAIGLILIMKQIPHFLGFDEDAFGEMSFLGTDGRNTFEEIFYSFEHINPGALIVGVLSLMALILWEQSFIKGNKVLKMIPGGLIAVTIGLIANVLFAQFAPQYYISAGHLVSLPAVNNLDSLTSLVVFPDFSALLNPKVYVVAGTLAIIASLETLLSIEAVDKLDPEKRRTPQNKELFAQGIGNTISGLIGGLPMTAVIVRSSANLDAGAKTKMSAIYHAILLLLAVLVFAPFLNQIPLAALASILLLVGYKLSKPGLYASQFNLGREQFIPFIVTVVAILFTDLLVGILIGMSVGVYYILRANYRVSHFYNEEEHEEGGILKINIKLSEHVSFLNKASLLLALEELPENSHVIVDGTSTKAIDYDVLEILYNFKETAKGKGIKLFLKNIPKFKSVNLH
jgi:MFS superfamily sulfate permease-like transporter